MKSSDGSPDTREKVVEATISLLRRAGYEGAGINRILDQSGAPKGSLYHFFPQGKRQIVRAALEVYAARIVALFNGALSRGRTPGAKVRRLLEIPALRLEESDYLQSCAAGGASLDLDPGLETVRAAVAGFFDALVGVFEKHFAFADRKRARSFAGLLLTVIEGAYVRGRAERSSVAFREAAEWLAELAEREAAQARPPRGGVRSRRG